METQVLCAYAPVFLWYHWGLKEKCHSGDAGITLNGVYARNGSVSQFQEIAPLTRVGKYRRGKTQNSGTPGGAVSWTNFGPLT